MFAPIHSSLLYLGPSHHLLDNMELELANTAQQALEVLNIHKFKTLIVHDSYFSELHELRHFLKKAQALQPSLQTLLVKKQFTQNHIITLINENLIQWMCSNENLITIDNLLRKILEKHDENEQQVQLFKLFNEQNERLENLRKTLEDRVKKRQAYLLRSEKKLASTNEQINLLHSSLIAVHQARSVKEMESLLFHALKKSLYLDWVRIIFNTQSNLNQILESKDQHKILKLPILTDSKTPGIILFARDSRRPFRSEDEELLDQVSEAVSLSISRLIALEESEAIKAQWETTFDAFSEPLCLIDKKQQIIRSNHAMVIATGRPYKDLIGKNPFEIMLSSQSKNIEQLTPPFRRRVDISEDGTQIIYDIFCQWLTDSPQEDYRIVIFRDVTEEARLEKHALESAKMAELGIIGSSIAHELNNPLGGMISFLQLMKMDLKKDDPLLEDVVAMEAAAKKCKDIIESLLGFARKEGENSESSFIVDDAIHHALKLVEIQTKSMGIQVHWSPQNKTIRVLGNQNQIVQALRNILQNSIEAIERRRIKMDLTGTVGHIHIDTSVKGRHIFITLQDDGDGIPKKALPKIFNPLFSLKKTGLATGLGLTVAFKIINEHKGHLEFSSQLGAGTTARISMESLEL